MLRLRPYKNCDAKTIVKWISDRNEFVMWSAGILGDYPPVEKTLQNFSATVADDEKIYQFVAYDRSGMVGYLTLRFTDADKEVVRIGFVILNPKKRGKGYGQQMIHLAVKYATEFLRAKVITLGVFEGNEAAKKCYEACGFVPNKNMESVMYHIGGQNLVCLELEKQIVDDVAENPETDAEIESLDEIIANNRYKYAFQPIVEAATGDIYGYEALMRAGDDGNIMPLVVLEYAEKNNKLYEIEKATFRNVLRTVSENAELFAGKKVFINSIPGKQLKPAEYWELKNKHQDKLGQCVVEVTETSQFDDVEIEVLQRLSKTEGFEIAIDDYGTGYSNTTNLLKIMPHYVKIDRLLISDIHQDSKKQHFVRSMVEFAHDSGFLTLAEGVETSAELRSVIEIGIDLIQGYYTARPAFEIIREILPSIRNEIINSNVRGQTQATRKFYTVTDETELPLMRVALEKNTGILIARPEFTLVGNPDYSATMSVKIKDGTKCRLTLQDVLLESFQDLPCIEIGENVDLIIELKGENKIRKVGICVPESSKVTFVGDGNLSVHAQGIQAYGIGNSWEAGVGSINWDAEGQLYVLTEADQGIGVGGGNCKKANDISVTKGMVKIVAASKTSVAIGCVSSAMPILIQNAEVELILNTETGVGIGSMSAGQNTRLDNMKLKIQGSGNYLYGVGGMGDDDGRIVVNGSCVDISCSGQFIGLMGTKAGATAIEMNKSNMHLYGEGSQVMGLGSKDKKGFVKVVDTEFDMEIRSVGHMAFGAEEAQVCFEGGSKRLEVNK